MTKTTPLLIPLVGFLLLPMMVGAVGADIEDPTGSVPDVQSLPSYGAIDLDGFLPTYESNAVPLVTDWAWDGTIGFELDANHTMVTIDATKPINTIPLNPILTPYIDITLVGLEAGRLLTIATSEGRVYNDAAYADGTVVMWHVATLPLAISISDGKTGEPITNVLMTLSTEPQAQPDASGYDRLTRPCGSCGGPYDGGGWESPHSYYWERTDAPAYVNGVKSFTSDIMLRIDQCWEHGNTIFAKVSGGYAGTGGSVGGTRSYAQNICSGTSSTNGLGQISGPMLQFEKDTYSDGSWKVWSPAPQQGYSSVNWNWNPSRGSSSLQFQNCATNTGQYYSLMERNTGSVTWSGSWNVFGVSGEAGTASTSTNQAALRFECKAPDNNLHHYSFYVVTGDGRLTGMIGAVWKDY